MLKKVPFITFICLLWVYTSMNAQTEETRNTDGTMVSDEMTKNPEQNAAWRTGAETYSAKPRDMWEFGLHGGIYNITGDLSPLLVQGFGAGLHLRKSLSYSLSLRGDLFYGQATNVDLNTVGVTNLRAEGYRDIANLYEGRALVRNHRTTTFSAGLQLVVNVGNIMFHNASNKWNFYALIGPAISLPSTYINALDANGNAYDFSALNNIDISDAAGKKEYRDAAKAGLDDTYETLAPSRRGAITIGDDRVLLIEMQTGVGFSRKITRRFNIGLEYRLGITGNDRLDGWEYRTGVDRSNNSDIQHYVNARLGFNLGNFDKKVEPLYWVNPLDAAMKDLAEVKSRPVFDLTDTDGDGVIDLLDQDPNTPAGVAVDVRGIPMDSDRDGVPDYLDKEPFSPAGYEVDEEGVAIVPDSDRPWVTEARVNEMINKKMAEQKMDWWLPMIQFDLDRYDIKPEFYSQLHAIAQVAKAQPQHKIKVIGFADNRGTEDYNKVLSYRRAQAAIDYLMARYDLPRDRFVIHYQGADNPLVPGLPARKNLDNRREMQQNMNRRVEFSIASPQEMNMSEPKGPDAGKTSTTSEQMKTKFSGNTNPGY